MSFLQKKIFDVFPSSFGLDLSDLSIKVLRMEREGSVHKVNGFASAALPIGSVIDGEILKPEVVVDVIRRLMEEPAMKKMHTRRVVCSLPETKAFLRVISLPLMEEKEVSEAIRWEIEANIPLTLDQVYIEGVARSCLGDPQRAAATTIETGATSVPVSLMVLGERTVTHSGGVAFTLLRTESPLPTGALRTFAPEPTLARLQERTPRVPLDFLGRTRAQTFARATLPAQALGADGYLLDGLDSLIGLSDLDLAAPVVMANRTLVGLLGEIATRPGRSAATLGSVVSVHRQMPWVSHVMAGSLDRQRSQLAPFPAATDTPPTVVVEPTVERPTIENTRPGTPEFDRYVREQE